MLEIPKLLDVAAKLFENGVLLRFRQRALYPRGSKLVPLDILQLKVEVSVEVAIGAVDLGDRDGRVLADVFQRFELGRFTWALDESTSAHPDHIRAEVAKEFPAEGKSSL